jgi:hypothetical protein
LTSHKKSHADVQPSAHMKIVERVTPDLAKQCSFKVTIH